LSGPEASILHDVGVKYLQAEVESKLKCIDEFKDDQKKTRCTIMSDDRVHGQEDKD
jgi:hypothetical protein